MSQTSFIHLRVHSEYSIVDSLIKLPKLFEKLSSQNMPAVALTDEMNFFAAVKFYKQAQKTGIKPIFGADIWLESANGHFAKLCLLCMNHEGYQNLTFLISRAYQEGLRLDEKVILRRAWLTQQSLSGLIALSCAHEGELGTALIQGDDKALKVLIQTYHEWFPNNRFYIEIQRIGKAIEKTHEPLALNLAAVEKLPVVATHNVRFLDSKDFSAHEIRVAINAGFTLEDSQRPQNYTKEQHLCTENAIKERFSDIPEALYNTVEIAKRCNMALSLNDTFLPDFPVPENTTINKHLETQSLSGLKMRFLDMQHHNIPNESLDTMKKNYHERLMRELKVIAEMDFPGYFLIVADFIQWAKDNGIPVGPGRGSGAGSIVAYALGITDIDPIPYDLLFERFLNPERVSMPDFDIDFCILGRDRVIDYVAQKYGRQSVSQIITYGTMAAKAVIRDVGRVMGHPYGFIDTIAKLVPNELGMTLDKALKEDEAFRARYESEDDIKAIVDMGLELEGTVRNVGKHAGGVVIAPSKITDFMPTFCEEGSLSIVTQFDKDDVETIGLVKFDFLGLRNLTIIDATVKVINKKHQDTDMPLVDIRHIPLNDKKTFELLKCCETTGVFQLESRGMKKLIGKLKPDCFEEIIALVALFRPGPLQSGMVDDFIDRKHGKAIVQYPHPLTKSILKPTYGIILYQEQVMLISQVLGGYSLGAADLLRRAMGKKKPEEMAKQRKIFIEGATKNNIDNDTASHIFDLMEKFAAYGFNKSHSAAYALIAYQTAWLKAHYPAAFMAALLSSDMDNTDKIVVFVEDAISMGLTIKAPDINVSIYQFLVAEEISIRFGLGAIKGLGENAIEVILAERAKAPFADLFDFCRRIDLRKVNRRSLEALIYSGAMDKMGPNRASLLASIDCAIQAADQYHQTQQSGQADLFAEMDDDAAPLQVQFIKGSKANMQNKLFKEKAVLGVFLSGHPMHEYQSLLAQLNITPLAKLTTTSAKNTVKIAGIVVSARRIRTKTGKVMRIITLDDNTSRMEITVFSELADQFKALLKVDQLLIMEVSVTEDKFSSGIRVIPSDIIDISTSSMRFAKRLTLKINETHAQNNVLEQLYELCSSHLGGNCKLSIYYQNKAATTLLHCDDNWQLTLSNQFLEDLSSLIEPVNMDIKYAR